METKVLSSLMRIFCFFLRWLAALDDSGAAEEGAWEGQEAGVAAEGPTAAAVVGEGGGTVGPQMT
jgi:hypothetical protein